MQRKHSSKRERILDAIRSSCEHPTAEQIYSGLKGEIYDLSLGTVYRNIAMFKEEGNIISVGVVDGKERLDGNLAPHSHFICDCCGRVEDIAQDEERDIARLEKRYGIRITECAVTYKGKCKSCIGREN